MRIAAVIFYTLLVLPVHTGVLLRYESGMEKRAYVMISVNRLRVSFSCALQRNASNGIPMLVLKNRREFFIPLKRKKKRRLSACFPPFAKAVKGWKRLLFFHLNAKAGCRDAAVTALFCGAINALISALPHIRGRALPDYQQSGLSFSLSCIADFRLGKLILTIALAGAAWLWRILSGGAFGGNHQRPANQNGHADRVGKHQRND